MFSVKSIPIPLHFKTTSTTQIKVSPYFAVSDDGRYYLEPTIGELQSCTGTGRKLCSSLSLPRKPPMHSCTSAIFFGSLLSVKKLCQFQVFPPTSDLFSYILDYMNSSVLISTNDSPWVEDCDRKMPLVIPSCTLCVITRKCHCSISGQNFGLCSKYI